MNARILVVDDDKQNREVIARMLKKRGMEADLAADARSAMDKIAENTYHLVITDKNMPGVERHDEGGMDVLAYIRQHQPQVPVMMITGFASVETAIEAMKLGAFDYVTKPFVMEELMQKVERTFEYRRFINPENTISYYKDVQNEVLSLVGEMDKAVDSEHRYEIINSFNAKLDSLFDQIKIQENIIIEQRDTLSEIESLSEQLLLTIEPEHGAFSLVEAMCDKAKKRV